MRSAFTLVVSLLSMAVSVSAISPKVDKFRALAKKNNGIVTLDAELYDEITQGARDYSVSILMTAMGAQFKCQPCQ